ncbi:MAG: VOC family protein [Planctomycetota bacterium]|nr:VOC family protein [Planctomycetota bacterium]
MPFTKKVTPFLWFDDKAHEAAKFYVETFPNSRIISPMTGPGGNPIGVKFEIDGREFVAFNGGPMFKFTEAISLFIDCETQEEVDRIWDRLVSDGGSPSHCGWLKDKYGLSWQVVPRCLMEYMSDPDRVKAGRAMQAMMGMSKLDIAALKAAFDGV